MVKLLFVQTLAMIILLSCSTSIRNNSLNELFPSHTYEREYYQNGSLMYETMYKDGIIDGYVKSWDKKGDLVSKVEYKNGILCGKWTIYYGSGLLKHTVIYKNGKKNGVEIWYHENGKKQSEIIYVDDIVQSDTVRWDQEGRRIIE